MVQSNQSPESPQQESAPSQAAAGQTGAEGSDKVVPVEQPLPTNAQSPESPSPESPPAPTQPEQAPAQQEQQRSVEAADRDDQVILPHVADDQTQENGGDNQTNAQETGNTDAGSDASAMPTVADDVDVIEKAWVNKAKQIIENTKDDPHAQEEEFEKLQIEYHKKRYGRDIKAAR
jgi:hypothetical protein